jgi:hypothetical protein
MHLPDIHQAQLVPCEGLALTLIPHASLQAILVLDSPDVDLKLWNDTVTEMEASGTPLSIMLLSLHTGFPGL